MLAFISEVGLVILGVVLLVLFILLIMSFKVIRQSNTAIVERLGKYIKTLDNGFHVIIPFIIYFIINFTLKLKKYIIVIDKIMVGVLIWL